MRLSGTKIYIYSWHKITCRHYILKVNNYFLCKTFPHTMHHAVFGYHSYQYANELKFTNLDLFSISNNCRQFGNDLLNGCRDMGTQHCRPAYLQALVFQFMFLNLTLCDGLNNSKGLIRLNPNIIFTYVVSRHIGLPDKKIFRQNLMRAH